MKKEIGFATRCVHAGEGPSPKHHSHTTPIYQTSTFVFRSADEAAARFSGREPGYRYIRSPPNTPTHSAFVEKLASLEGGEAGLSFSSGMAAEAAVIMSLLKAGDLILANNVIYGGTYGLLSSLTTRLGMTTEFVDTTDPGAVEEALGSRPKLVFLESPANPTLSLCDIREICRMARERGALTLVDNTFASPFFQRPLELGADLVVESCTKYIGGHSDLLGGAVVGSLELIRPIARTAALTGGTMGPHEAWLCIRGLKTLHLRMERHASNALEVARFLEGHPDVEWVRYPGLESHPQHDLARRQMSGFSGMVSFGVRGGVEAGKRLMDTVELCILSVSLGSVDTLIEHPASMTHAGLPKDARLCAGITDDLVRISVGIEDVDDIIADLDQALEKI